MADEQTNQALQNHGECNDVGSRRPLKRQKNVREETFKKTKMLGQMNVPKKCIISNSSERNKDASRKKIESTKKTSKSSLQWSLSLSLSLFQAIQQGDMEMIKTILTTNPECINRKIPYTCNSGLQLEAQTPLHHAIQCCSTNISMVSYLIKEAGASVFLKNSMGRAPIFTAVQTRSVEMVKVLLQHGAKAHCVDSFSKTPLYYAGYDLEMAQLLLENGAQISYPQTSEYANSLLDLAVWKHKEDMVDLLLRLGLDNNKKKKKNMDKVDSMGETMLFRAVTRQDEHSIDILLDRNVNVNIPNNMNWETALMRAVQLQNIRIVQTLLDHGANVNSLTLNGKTAWMMALSLEKNNINSNNQTSIFDRLKHKINVNYIQRDDNRNGNSSSSSSSIGIYDNNMKGQSLLKYYVQKGNHSQVHTLLNEYKADPNIAAPYNKKETPLFDAIRQKDTKMIRLLIQSGANVNTFNFRGDTPWTLAQELNLHQISAIMNKLIDVNYTASWNKNGTVLHLLAGRKGGAMSYKISRILSKKPNLNCFNDDGNTPLHLAIKNKNPKKHIETIQLLLSNGANSHGGGGDGSDSAGRPQGGSYTPFQVAALTKYPDALYLCLLHAGLNGH